MIDGVHYINKCIGVTATVPDPSILNVPRSKSQIGDRLTQMPGMCEIVRRAPEAAVNVDDDRRP